MKDLLQQADEIPVTLLVALAWATLAVLTKPFGPAEEFGQHLQQFGWLTPGLCADGEPWRLLGYAFLHGGVVHLLLNMSALFTFAPALEKSLGSVRFALLYLVTAVTGGLACCLVDAPGQPVVGGSGALFGMMGAVIAMNMRSGRHVFAFLDFEGPRRLLGWIVVQIALGFFLPMISNAGHIGGLLGGIVLTFLWLRPGDATPALRQWRWATTALAASLLFWSLQPVTRWDAIGRELQGTGDRQRAELLLQAYQRATGRSLTAPDDEPAAPRPR